MTIKEQVIDTLAKKLDWPADEIHVGDRLKDFGFDSLDCMDLTYDCEHRLKMDVGKDVITESTTVGELIGMFEQSK